MKYDWTNWTDGSIWLIRRGEDFSSKPESMRRLLYYRALTERRFVKTQAHPEGWVFQFSAPE